MSSRRVLFHGYLVRKRPGNLIFHKVWHACPFELTRFSKTGIDGCTHLTPPLGCRISPNRILVESLEGIFSPKNETCTMRMNHANERPRSQTQDESSAGGGSWGVAFHPRSPRHLFSCSGTGVLTKWYVPPKDQAPQPAAAAGGGGVVGRGWGDGGWESLRGARHLYELPSRTGLVGVCYDETADTIAAISKHGHVVVAQGVAGLRL